MPMIHFNNICNSSTRISSKREIIAILTNEKAKEKGFAGPIAFKVNKSISKEMWDHFPCFFMILIAVQENNPWAYANTCKYTWAMTKRKERRRRRKGRKWKEIYTLRREVYINKERVRYMDNNNR